MPKKPAKKAVAKKTKPVAKKTVVKKVSAVKSSSANNGFLVKEQEEFHQNHPSAFNLILVFLILFMSLVMVYFYKYGFFA